jgi:hypothetical protein
VVVDQCDKKTGTSTIWPIAFSAWPEAYRSVIFTSTPARAAGRWRDRLAVRRPLRQLFACYGASLDYRTAAEAIAHETEGYKRAEGIITHRLAVTCGV